MALLRPLAWVIPLLLLIAGPVRAEGGRTIASMIKPGPFDITLKDQAVLHLPSGYGFLPVEPATEFMAQLGNQVDSRFLGMILPSDPDSKWMVVLEYENAGYVKDDDAQHWNADDLLESLKEGTEAQNARRRAQHIPEIEVIGWAKAPLYDDHSHQLKWSAVARDKGANPGPVQTINYNTYALGREGYMSLNLVTDTDHIGSDKHVATELLGDLQFDSGKRYEDFNSSTDHVAAYGLAALVVGVAAKKVGLLAAIGLFLAKGVKLVAVAVVAAIAGLKKFLGVKDKNK